MDFIQQLGHEHAAKRQKDAQLELRIQSFELAYRMQMEAADVFDINREPKHIREMYGKGTQARQLLIARRLVERGVRFVQVWHEGGQPWTTTMTSRSITENWPVSPIRRSGRCYRT